MSAARRNDEPAVVVDHLSKRFRIFHERNQYLKTSVLRGRRARYEDFWAVRDVSFDVHRGEAFGIIGHNGSGKSTLLKCLTGILVPDEGRVASDGSISALLELGAGFHPELSGRENVFLNAAILGLTRKEISAKFDEIVEFSGLEQFIDTPVKNYSSGMYVRLGFAVAINVDPDILIIDEVLAVGDAEFQAKCGDKIADFRERGKTIILVTHGLADVLKLCERAAWLDHGQLRMLGDPKEVTDAYQGVAHEGRTVEAQAGTRWGTGEARIVKVEALDAKGAPAQFARTGEPFVLRLHVESFKPLQNVVVGLAVHHQSGTYVTGTNTRRQGRTITDLDEVPYVDLVIDRMPLLEGTYQVSCAINDWTEQRDIDYWQNCLRFDVLTGSPPESGLVTLGGTWRVGSSVAPVKNPR